MQDTIENLQETANKNKNLLTEKKIRDLLLGLSGKEEIPQIVRELNLPISEGQGSIILIELRDTESKGVYELAKISEMVWQILKTNLDLFSTQEKKAVLQTLSLRRFCILSAKSGLDQLRISAQSIKHEILGNTGLDTTTAIREIRPQETIPEVYDRAFVLLHSSSNQRFNLLMEGQENLINPYVGIVYALDTEKELIKALQGGDVVSIQSLVAHIISQNRKANVPIAQLSQAFHVTILRVVQSTGVGVDLAKSFETINTQDSREFQELTVKGLILLSQEIIRKDKKESENFSQEVIRYIEENYNKNISLTDVADHFQFSMVYMSTLFKNTAGINFKEYLTNVQVEHAKELIENGEKIYTVSVQVGCNSVDTFIRMFKRVTGISPGKYQQKYIKSPILNNEPYAQTQFPLV
jgi:AraC-like DNA-binding protein